MPAKFTNTIRRTLNSLARRGDFMARALLDLDSSTPASVAVDAVPTATSDLVGHLLVVTAANQPSQVKVCVPNSAGGFEWVTLQQSS